MKIKKISAWRATRLKQLHKEYKRLKSIPLVKHLIKRFDSPIAIYEAQMIEQGLISKKLVEEAYDQFQLDYHEIWPDLTFEQRSKFINREMKPLFSRLSYVTLDTGTRIYLPFFNERFNRFYRDSIAVMDLPHFRQQFVDYHQHCIRPSSYGQVLYTGDFSQVRLLTAASKSDYLLVDTINELVIRMQHNRPQAYYLVSKKDLILYNEDVVSEVFTQLLKENI